MGKEKYIGEKDLKHKSKEWLSRCKSIVPPYRDIRLDIKHSALLVIDMQRYFLDPKSHAFVPSGVSVIENVNRLISHYKENSLPIVITQHGMKKGKTGSMGRWWKKLLMEEDPMVEVDPRILCPEDAILIKKDRYDAFHRTGLESMLKNKGVRQVVITGLMTHLCCESTARGAFVRDFDVFMVVDATASITESFHISSLMSCAHGFSMVLGTEEILNEVL